jgi:hypothetical protein
MLKFHLHLHPPGKKEHFIEYEHTNKIPIFADVKKSIDQIFTNFVIDEMTSNDIDTVNGQKKFMNFLKLINNSFNSAISEYIRFKKLHINDILFLRRFFQIRKKQ